MSRMRVTSISITNGFVENLHAGIEVAVADRGVLRVAGDEQDLQTGPGDPCHIRHLPPVHAAG